ncbi:Hypothetical_protein [Hexamita inflata]|uniref:Hypothetical_protein n=1 Tax=Hexamita inflata TaxID=28002 RepID=A0AA86UXA2_9EUKA|nr:Hypothetical protein HINF_LOCUS39498 [Hexamita inflata]
MCCCSNRHILAYSLLLAWHTNCEAKTQPFQYLSSKGVISLRFTLDTTLFRRPYTYHTLRLAIQCVICTLFKAYQLNYIRIIWTIWSEYLRFLDFKLVYINNIVSYMKIIPLPMKYEQTKQSQKQI